MGMRVRVFECLREKNMFQTKLADETGITRQTISNFLHGKHSLRLNAAVSIVTALDVSTDYLFNLTNEPKRKTNTSVDIFPQKLKQVMIKRNMKEKELALQTGISVSTIYQYIDGRMLPTIGAFLTKNLL